MQNMQSLCQFSNDGQYCVQLSTEGILRVWNTATNVFEQEFTPNFHLNSQCSCFQIEETNFKSGSPRKKRRKSDVQGGTMPNVVLGTSSGLLLVYSLSKAELEYTVDSKTSQRINCLTTSGNGAIYSGSDNNILVWNLFKRNLNCKWGTGNEKVSAILCIPSTDHLLTASKSIKLWSIKTKEVVKVFTGHSSYISLLRFVNIRDSLPGYFISGSTDDRLLNCWNMDQNIESKNAIACFLMDDVVNNVSVFIDNDGTTSVATTVRSGVVHIYRHTLNGKCTKPLKPKTTIQVVSDSQESVVPIHITAANFRDAQTLCISYGISVIQTFEGITISSFEKLQCLMRAPAKNATSQENQISKTKIPIVGKDVNYLVSSTSIPKRKNDGQQEIPMEKRLENLIIMDSDSKGVPQANNVAHLLVQGLHSKDKNILRTVFLKKDEQLIKNTIKKIPINVVQPLFEELANLVKGKTLSRKIALIWLRNLVGIHAGLLLSNPQLPKVFGEVLGTVESTLALQAQRNKLMGRLELLVGQIQGSSAPQDVVDDDKVLVFNDKDSDDSENEIEFDINSNSEHDWESEEDGEEEAPVENDAMEVNNVDESDDSDQSGDS